MPFTANAINASGSGILCYSSISGQVFNRTIISSDNSILITNAAGASSGPINLQANFPITPPDVSIFAGGSIVTNIQGPVPWSSTVIVDVNKRFNYEHTQQTAPRDTPPTFYDDAIATNTVFETWPQGHKPFFPICLPYKEALGWYGLRSATPAAGDLFVTNDYGATVLNQSILLYPWTDLTVVPNLFSAIQYGNTRISYQSTTPGTPPSPYLQLQNDAPVLFGVSLGAVSCICIDVGEWAILNIRDLTPQFVHPV